MSLNIIIVLSQRYENLRIKPEGSQKEREAVVGRGRPGGMKGGLPPFGTTSSSQYIIMVLIYIIGVIVNASSNGNRLAFLTGIG